MKTKEELILENLIYKVEKEEGKTMFLLGLKIALIEIKNKDI